MRGWDEIKRDGERERERKRREREWEIDEYGTIQHNNVIISIVIIISSITYVITYSYDSTSCIPFGNLLTSRKEGGKKRVEWPFIYMD